jgi:hypothetical protein
MATQTVTLPLPVLPSGWSAEKDFKAVASLSQATQRNIEPVGPHFLAHARRKRHNRTFSEDERIQAAENVKKVEDDDDGEISEEEDPLMLQRDAKDWKVCLRSSIRKRLVSDGRTGTRPLCRTRPLEIPLPRDGGPDQARPSQEGSPTPSRQESGIRQDRRRLLLQVHPESYRNPSRSR